MQYCENNNIIYKDDFSCFEVCLIFILSHFVRSIKIYFLQFFSSSENQVVRFSTIIMLKIVKTSCLKFYLIIPLNNKQNHSLFMLSKF